MYKSHLILNMNSCKLKKNHQKTAHKKFSIWKQKQAGKRLPSKQPGKLVAYSLCFRKKKTPTKSSVYQILLFINSINTHRTKTDFGIGTFASQSY